MATLLTWFEAKLKAARGCGPALIAEVHQVLEEMVRKLHGAVGHCESAIKQVDDKLHSLGYERWSIEQAKLRAQQTIGNLEKLIGK